MIKDLKLTYLKKATKFLSKNSNIIQEKDVDILIISSVKKLILKENINVDVKPLRGTLEGKFRVRKGKVRIIFEIFEGEIVIEAIIEDIDFRGNVY